MIIDADEISYLIQRKGNDADNYDMVIHNRHGAFIKLPSDNEVMFVGQYDRDFNISKEKEFDVKSSSGFFEAVEYFESLIADSEEVQEPDTPSFGALAISKGRGFVVLAMDESLNIVIENEDLQQVLKLDKNGKTGLLDITKAINKKPEYQLLNMPLAVRLNDELTELAKNSYQDDNAVGYLIFPFDPNNTRPEDFALSQQSNQGGQGDQDGQDGQDGQGGQDGQDGQDGQGGQDGQDGQDGQGDQDGQDGQDGQGGQGGQDGQDGQGGDSSGTPSGYRAISESELIGFLNNVYNTNDIKKLFPNARVLIKSLQAGLPNDYATSWFGNLQNKKQLLTSIETPIKNLYND